MTQPDYLISLYFKDGEFFQCINGQLIQLNPWIGVQIEEWKLNGRDWKRKDITKHEPNDLLKYLERVATKEEREELERRRKRR
jgi:hypothetical protein